MKNICLIATSWVKMKKYWEMLELYTMNLVSKNKLFYFHFEFSKLTSTLNTIASRLEIEKMDKVRNSVRKEGTSQNTTINISFFIFFGYICSCFIVFAVAAHSCQGFNFYFVHYLRGFYYVETKTWRLVPLKNMHFNLIFILWPMWIFIHEKFI